MDQSYYKAKKFELDFSPLRCRGKHKACLVAAKEWMMVLPGENVLVLLLALLIHKLDSTRMLISSNAGLCSSFNCTVMLKGLLCVTTADAILKNEIKSGLF